MPKILIIDDEPDLRLALSATLEDHGFDVEEGSNGSQAIELAVKHSPDVIILDVNMPIVDGMTALKALKADSRTAGIPVCILTAIKDPTSEAYASEIGAADFFGKPWSEERLIRRLTEIIERRSNGSGGSMTMDICSSSNGLASASIEANRIDRESRLMVTIQSRHNTVFDLS